ncbi:hypothetical protein Aeqsu_1887 [Aequorivita sublithincola DSM 14238]|uniref:Uncharacterized protein n=1 Tax=Aequorivita sublithincola (strain DSM 14238 / LMG 21431 / ACAM 643 / 9-3) TaxID=746697 RepID=I3YWJ4_AEQSU|nr:hypothetical protein Aeqsu_1887 [Aequorivita sublithincola DSM 14238]
MALKGVLINTFLMVGLFNVLSYEKTEKKAEKNF